MFLMFLLSFLTSCNKEMYIRHGIPFLIVIWSTGAIHFHIFSDQLCHEFQGFLFGYYIHMAYLKKINKYKKIMAHLLTFQKHCKYFQYLKRKYGCKKLFYVHYNDLFIVPASAATINHLHLSQTSFNAIYGILMHP